MEKLCFYSTTKFGMNAASNLLEEEMKIALSILNNRIAPVFDVSRSFAILTIEHGHVVDRREINPGPHEWGNRAGQLAGMKVEVLICGALSRELADSLALHHIQVFSFIAGRQEEVVSAYLQGILPHPALSMPGCCGQRRRYRGSRCWKRPTR